MFQNNLELKFLSDAGPKNDFVVRILPVCTSYVRICFCFNLLLILTSLPNRCLCSGYLRRSLGLHRVLEYSGQSCYKRTCFSFLGKESKNRAEVGVELTSRGSCQSKMSIGGRHYGTTIPFQNAITQSVTSQLSVPVEIGGPVQVSVFHHRLSQHLSTIHQD